MHLVIFDIDGTLTQTNQVDSDCFAQAIQDSLQINHLNTHWASYSYSTDSGLLKEIYEQILQRPPTHPEEKIVQQHFVDYLKQAWSIDKTQYAPVPGADTVFDQIYATKQWHIGIATGGWQESALFKLEAAAIPHAPLPKAYANDHVERTEIIKKVIAQAKKQYHTSHYERIVYVGDRAWDKRAANELQIEFIGVGKEFTDKQETVFSLPDFKNNVTILNYLYTIATN